MTTQQSKKTGLSQDIDYLNTLDKLRVQARSLRDKGIEAIVDFDLEDHENWEQDISNNEKVLFRRAKHLAWNLGRLKEFECDSPDHLHCPKEGNKLKQRCQTTIKQHYPKWPVIQIRIPESDAQTASIDLFNMPGEPAPILFAANFLRTRLGNLPGFLDEETLFCYYRIIRELYNLHDTNWALGAARPGEQSGKPSIFVTTECTRAIGYFARLMENTSVFLKRLHETKEYVAHVNRGKSDSDPGIPALNSAWCDSELDWCTASAKTTIEGFRDYVALQLPDLKEVTELEKIIERVEMEVRCFVNNSVESFSSVKKCMNRLRAEERRRFHGMRRELSKNLENEQMPRFDLTDTAHRLALGALAGSSRAFLKIIEPPKGPESQTKTARVKRRDLQATIETANIPDLLDKASKLFAQLATWLRTHLAPAKEYFEKNLHRCLIESMRSGSPRVVQDLAFSALSVGLISKDWGQPDYRQAIEILCDNLDEYGQFPDGPPFCYTAKGEGRVVINAQVIRAFAQLAQHLAGKLNPEVVERFPKVIERMIGYFRSHCAEHDRGIAWPSLRSLQGKPSSLWVSSLSVLSLHRIVLMLDAHINAGVKKHFNTKSTEDLKREGVPFLHQLMSSDVGYVSVRGRQGLAPKRVVMELEGMRAHLLGAGRANRALQAKDALGELPLRSLVLYGPPGTGKTTLVKSLALTSGVDLVEVMSHDLYRQGVERVMEQASDVMDALKLLTSTVVLFDEFEPILHTRIEAPVRITEMLTGNMLPKLDALYKAAEKNGLAYVLSTNYAERLDSAAIREGRFDRMRFIYYPDGASRTCRLVSEFRRLMDDLKKNELLVMPIKGADLRLLEIVAKTAICQVPRLCRTGWFVRPKIESAPGPNGKKMLYPETEDQLRPVWRYIIWNEGADAIKWELFGSAESGRPADTKPAVGDEQKEIQRVVKHWDELLRDATQRRQINWEQAIELLTSDVSEVAATPTWPQLFSMGAVASASGKK